MDVTDLSTLTAEQLRDGNPALFAALTGGLMPGYDDGEVPGDEVVADDADVTEALYERVDRLERALREPAARAEAKRVVVDTLKESTLPAAVKATIVERFQEASVGDGFLYETPEELGYALEHEIGLASKMVEGLTGKRPSMVTGLGSSPDDNTVSLVESVEGRLGTRFGTDRPTPWKPITGDEGDGGEVRESASSGSVEDRLASRLGL